MKAIILAGGLGTRLTEETATRPKPMVEIGGYPILWHILKMYSHQGINDFVICCGYKGYLIKEYFANYFLHMSDVTFSMETNQMEVHHKRAEPWTVTLIDTGDNSMTGGRLGRVAEYVKDEEAFCFTYGDGVGDVDISATIAFHRNHGKAATLTAAYPPGRFGALDNQGKYMKNNLLELPRADNEHIKALIEQLITWSAGTKNKQDGPMALWFAETQMRDYINQSGSYGGTFVKNPFATPMDLARRKVVNLEEYAQLQQKMAANGGYL